MSSPESADTATGYVMRLVDEAYPAYSFAWVIDKPDFCCPGRYESPKFTTGTAEHQNIWKLSYIMEKVESCVNTAYHHSYILGTLTLRSLGCTESKVKKRVIFSFLGSKGEKFFERSMEIVISDDTVHSVGIDMSVTKQLCEINKSKLIVCCRISDCMPTILVSNLICNDTYKINPPKHKITDDFEAIMLSERLSDATLLVSGKEFHVHKSILASRSPVFMAAFENDMQERRSNTIDIPDIKPEVMHKLLSYIYTDRVENIEESAKDLIAAAEKYQLEELKSLCLKSMMESLNEQNAIETLILADLYHAHDLKDQTYNFIAVHAKSIHELQGYESLGESGRADLLEALSAIGAVRNIR